MSELFALLGTASIAFGLSRLAKIPVIALLVISGMLMDHIIALPTNLLKTSMELGLAFLLFSMGVELSPERFRNQFGPVILIGIFQLLVAAAASWLIAYSFGYDFDVSFAIALSIAGSSTIAVVRHLRQRAQVYEPFGRMVIGVLLIQDIVMLVAIVLWQKAERDKELWSVSGYLLLMAILAIILHIRIIPWLVKKFSEDTEILLLIALAVLFSFLGIAHYMKIPSIAGAFAGGFALSAFPVNGLMRAQLTSITDFFLAFFFVSVGALITIPDLKGLLLMFSLVATLFIVTPIVVRIVAEALGISSRTSLETGLLLAQAGELALAAGLYAMGNGRIDSEIFSIIALATIITMAITPLVATDKTTFWLMHLRFFKVLKPKGQKPLNGHIIIIGFGTVGRTILPDLRASGRQIVILDDDQKIGEKLKKEGLLVINGDSMDKDVLDAAQVRNAHTVFCFARRIEDSLFVLRYLGKSSVQVIVRVPDEKAAARVRNFGGVPINSMQDAIENFLIWLGSDFSRKTLQRFLTKEY